MKRISISKDKIPFLVIVIMKKECKAQQLSGFELIHYYSTAHTYTHASSQLFAFNRIKLRFIEKATCIWLLQSGNAALNFPSNGSVPRGVLWANCILRSEPLNSHNEYICARRFIRLLLCNAACVLCMHIA